ncbi:MAG: multicopper oxidase family protein [Candidatus Palauibacterales bacterium]|nr:multicopper oxidase family protein [Candidatus Palauibacterales bacterium]
MPPMPAGMPMLPPLKGMTPDLGSFLPSADDPESLPDARYREVRRLSDGDTLSLEAMKVRRTIEGRTFTMYGFNGQYPGPLVEAPEDGTIVVEFTNELDMPSTVHWHGVRLDNRFDGVPDVTQEPVAPGESFTYHVHLPDPGIYWYHPHVRSDIQQDLGLYGNLNVRPPEQGYYNPVNREEVLILDDILLDGKGLFPYGRERALNALMGRFGNVFLVNGEPGYELTVDRGEVVRFFLTNVSATRTFNLHLGGARMKVVGADIGKFEREEWTKSLVIAPAQRYIVEARFPDAGTYAFTNRVQAIDHFAGEFYRQVDTLGTVSVRDRAAEEDHSEEFETLRSNEDVSDGIAPYREHFDDPVDHRLELTVRQDGLPQAMVAVMQMDTLFRPPVEWNDVMPMMNYLSTGRNVTWILREPETGRENMEIDWTFRQGEVSKIQIHNARRSLHPMQHPIHLHGQRFLVLSRDGERNGNLVWKDTVLIPVGSTVTLLLDPSNPGDWLLHCHISEHLEAGMKTVFTVEPSPGDSMRH